MYSKKMYLFEGNRPVPIVIRNYVPSDFDALIRVQEESFPPPFPSELWWNTTQLTNHVRLFPDGALCAEVEGEIAGSVTGLLVTWNPDAPDHSWATITDMGYITNHDPNGNTLYVVDISVRPAYRKLGIGKALMYSMYELVVAKGLDRLLGGARMPGYAAHAGALTPEQYLEEVVKGTVQDPIVTFLMRCGRMPVRVVHDYLDDEESGDCAVLMQWQNPFRAERVASGLRN
ncbi:MAG: GNAT family N-acetyltransferase [Candidatus Hydrogenedentes bacterium]|nr:GNAT family N-acetyltransferase [Candidatus Hydrogenedentota bacterium]